jgi:hypothetical protein
MRWLPALVAALLLGSAAAGADGKPAPKEESAFGVLKSPAEEAARKQAEAWLREQAGKKDAASLAAFKAIWEAPDKPLLDRVTRTLVLGSPEAARLLREARDPNTAAPTDVPSILKDVKTPAFLRANLALAYGKALTTRKVYEEALATLRTAKPEDVVDPASLLFHKAVCQHALMLKDDADLAIDRLLVDVTDSPERYRMVAALMHFDMVTWQDKDLGWIARKMDNIQRRLDLNRGGKHTQKIQKEVLVRLDEMIKEMENKQKQQQSGGG